MCLSCLLFSSIISEVFIGVSMELVKEENSVMWFRYMHNNSYQELQQAFWDAALFFDHSAIAVSASILFIFNVRFKFSCKVFEETCAKTDICLVADMLSSISRPSFDLGVAFLVMHFDICVAVTRP